MNRSTLPIPSHCNHYHPQCPYLKPWLRVSVPIKLQRKQEKITYIYLSRLSRKHLRKPSIHFSLDTLPLLQWRRRTHRNRFIIVSRDTNLGSLLRFFPRAVLRFRPPVFAVLLVDLTSSVRSEGSDSKEDSKVLGFWCGKWIWRGEIVRVWGELNGEDFVGREGRDVVWDWGGR